MKTKKEITSIINDKELEEASFFNRNELNHSLMYACQWLNIIDFQESRIDIDSNFSHKVKEILINVNVEKVSFKFTDSFA